MTQSLSTYIQHPEQLTTEVVDELYDLVERNPSFQTARLLLVRGLYQLQDERFGAELRKAALLIPDRNALYHLLEDDKLQPTASAPAQAPRQSLSSASDRTQSLIENFLDQLPDASKTRKSHSVSPSDPTDHSLPDFSVHGIFPGRNTGVGCHSLLQGIFPIQGSNPSLLHCR